MPLAPAPECAHRNRPLAPECLQARKFAVAIDATVEVSGWGKVKRYVEAGVGISVVPSLCVNETTRQLSIVTLDAPLPWRSQQRVRPAPAAPHPGRAALLRGAGPECARIPPPRPTTRLRPRM